MTKSIKARRTRPLNVVSCQEAVKSDRWISKIEISDDGCHLWTSFIDHYGYGRFTMDKLAQRAHRVALVAALGRDIKPGFTASHRCHDMAAEAGLCDKTRDCLHRRCVNPEHLMEESMRENSLASPNTVAGAAIRRDTCSRGHLLTIENLSASKLKNGTNACRTCDIQASRDRRALVGAAHRVLGITYETYASMYGESVRTAKRILEEHFIDPQTVIDTSRARWSEREEL